MYFAIIGIISLFVFLEMFNKDIIEKYKYVFAFTCFALLVFQDGFRWETGTDWDPYHNFFEELTISEQPEDSEFDIGDVWFYVFYKNIDRQLYRFSHDIRHSFLRIILLFNI